MPDIRHSIIGGRHRASTRYALICGRIANPVGKNACYKGVEMRFSKEDFIAWFMANDFKGGSVDRIDPNKHYEPGNVQMIPKEENSGKDKRKAVNGECRCYGCGETKPVTAFVKESRRITGYSTFCKECDRVRYHERKQRMTTIQTGVK